jgi:hypothetical protein
MSTQTGSIDDSHYTSSVFPEGASYHGDCFGPTGQQTCTASPFRIFYLLGGKLYSPLDEDSNKEPSLYDASTTYSTTSPLLSSPPSSCKESRRITSSCKTYTCHQCRKRFRQKWNLNRHLKIHKGIKPHICPCCHHAFSRSDHLLCHVRRGYTKEEIYILHENAIHCKKCTCFKV